MVSIGNDVTGHFVRGSSMAKKYAVKPADLGETIFPLCLDISGRRYKILVKSSHVKFISESKYKVMKT